VKGRTYLLGAVVQDAKAISRFALTRVKQGRIAGRLAGAEVWLLVNTGE
jgi:hypothetical protein